MATIFSLRTSGENVQMCPKCHKKHLTDNTYCEHCLYNFVSDFKCDIARLDY